MGDATQANIVIGMGVGELRIGAVESGGALVEGRVQVRPGERLTRSFNVSGTTASFTLRSEGRSSSIWPGPRRDDGRIWDLKLARNVPLDLTIDAGVSNSTVDLQDLRVTSLQAHSGVGTMDLRLPRAGIYRVKVSGGVGDLRLTIPEEVAARITVASHLGGLNIADAYVKAGETYTSPDYATAGNRADILIDSGIGSITVR
jgi:hypothetical protein